MLVIYAAVLVSINLAISTRPKSPNILVLGGSGRVGGSAVRALRNFNTQNSMSIDNLAVGGRKEQNWLEYQSIYASSFNDYDKTVKFESIDIYNPAQLRQLISKYDMIIHTAGPFQGLSDHEVLKCAMKEGKIYLDVCDDINLSRTARSPVYQQIAKQSGGKAIISTGIWPGCSSLLAKELVTECNAESTGENKVETVEFSFFTAGSGGAGPTILTATFLILGEDVLDYQSNQARYRKTGSEERLQVNFGPGIGKRDLLLMNLIETESCHVGSFVPSTRSFFGTAPPIWNTLFQGMTRFLPASFLKDRSAMNLLGIISLPMVRLVDKLVGGANGIRIDVYDQLGQRLRTGLLTHSNLEDCVGEAIALFARELYQATDVEIPPGIYFSEEIPSVEARKRILEDISKSALYFNKNHID